ncbi:MAG: aminopeptidase P family protein, partial [Deltaproteobacteria bacterium]|nr:aminopeptidase P family protein [Deltaproteobacteria bacterium]
LMYISRFTSPDQVIFCECNGEKYLLLSDLELDRGRSTAAVDRVLPFSTYQARTAGGKGDRVAVIDAFLREHSIRRCVVPGSTSAALVEALRQRRYNVAIGSEPFYPDRLCKRASELNAIAAAQRATFQAIRLAETILRAARIRNKFLYYRGNRLTSEYIKAELTAFLMRKGYRIPEGIIVSCGDQSINPHEMGHGPLRAHQSIIVDVFPRSDRTFYYGDATRTFCRGMAPPALKRLYRTVMAAQALGFRLIRGGIDGKAVHTAIRQFFTSKGYRTGVIDGRRQGFFHSTGHGLGLELHEATQRIGPAPYRLQPSHVFTVEPGLYYKGIGGIRIEDIVHVTQTGCRILGSHYPRHLEIL